MPIKMGWWLGWWKSPCIQMEF